MKDFDTKKEAEYELSQEREKSEDAYCPLIKDKCRFDCVCYYEGEVIEITGNFVNKPFRMYNPGCTNYSLVGES